MFKNYFKIAVRSFINQKYYSLLNTIGLALGIAACILILLFVQDELSYERQQIDLLMAKLPIEKDDENSQRLLTKHRRNEIALIYKQNQVNDRLLDVLSN